MNVRLRALWIGAPLILVAACGISPAGGSANPGAGYTPSPAASPATSNVALSETGATELFALMNRWGNEYHAKYPNVTITTAATGSGAGIAQAAAGAVTLGASGAYLSDDDMAAHRGLTNIALALSAVQVNYNLPGVNEHVKLNGKVLAEMYEGTIKTWNDPQVSDLNPGVGLPAIPVVPLHRSDGSGETFAFTQYLAKQDPDGWGRSTFGTTVGFPAIPGARGEGDAEGMVTGCAQTPGCVAYIGLSLLDETTGKGLGEAKLANASDHFLLPDAQSVLAEADGFASRTPADQAISLVNGPAANGYPIANYEYAVVYTKQKDPAVARTLQAFLHWVVTDGSNPSYLDQFHFQPLPAPVAKLSEGQIAGIT